MPDDSSTSSDPSTPGVSSSEEPRTPPLTHESGLEQIAALVVDDSQPSIVVLGGRQAVGRQFFVRAVAKKLLEWGQAARVLTIDLEGFENERLGDFLAVQVAKRRPAESEPDSTEAAEDLVEAMLAVIRDHLVPIYNPVTLAMILSMALDLDDPVAALQEALALPPIDDPSVPFLDPTLLDHSLQVWSRSTRALVHVVDAELLPTLLSGTGAGALTWLTIVAERLPQATLFLSCDLQTRPEALVPLSRQGVHAIGCMPNGPDRTELQPRVEALRKNLAARGAESSLVDSLIEFLVDAALCGPLVPVVPLLDRLGLDELDRDGLEDALDEFLVDEGEAALDERHPPLLIDLEYTHPGFPTDGPYATGPTYVFRFPDAQLRRALIESETTDAMKLRATELLQSFDEALFPTTRTVARLRAHVASEVSGEAGHLALRELAWWVRPAELPLLHEALVRSLDAETITIAELWSFVRQATYRSSEWRLAVLDACMTHGGYHLESLATDDRDAIATLHQALLRQEESPYET